MKEFWGGGCLYHSADLEDCDVVSVVYRVCLGFTIHFIVPSRSLLWCLDGGLAPDVSAA